MQSESLVVIGVVVASALFVVHMTRHFAAVTIRRVATIESVQNRMASNQATFVGDVEAIKAGQAATGQELIGFMGIHQDHETIFEEHNKQHSAHDSMAEQLTRIESAIEEIRESL